MDFDMGRLFPKNFSGKVSQNLSADRVKLCFIINHEEMYDLIFIDHISHNSRAAAFPFPLL